MSEAFSPSSIVESNAMDDQQLDHVDVRNSTKELEDVSAVHKEKSQYDANDYSRFKDVNDTESDSASSDIDKEENLQISQSIFQAESFKDLGNESFKASNYNEALKSYESALSSLKAHVDKKPPLISEEEHRSMTNLLISLHGNKAMVMIKQEDWFNAIKSATQVLKYEDTNVKALFRRGVGYFRCGQLEDAKSDLQKVISLDPTNVTAKKELADVLKAIKEHEKKQKAVYSGLFSKGSMYDDKEKERQQKLKQQEEEKAQLQDEWTKSKLTRREQGLDEQTFEQWKEERVRGLEGGVCLFPYVTHPSACTLFYRRM